MQIGYLQLQDKQIDKTIKYTTNISAIILKNFSEAFNIFSICFLFLLAIGLYKAALITGPIPRF